MELLIVRHAIACERDLSVCLTGSAGSAGFELRKMSVALVAFEGAPRAGQGELRWLLVPKLLRSIR